MKKKLIEHIIEKRITSLAIIGLAKNAGKTVTFNQLISEADDKGLKLALLSYGRDGEEIDAVTRQKKPRIYIPAYQILGTAEKAYDSSELEGDLLAHTGLHTLLGEVNLYQVGPAGGYIELVGINSAAKLQQVKRLLPPDIDLVMIDGAIDRRSSAMPSLVEGIILATGAVVGNSEQLVIKRTLSAINKLTRPAVKDQVLLTKVDQLWTEHSVGLLVENEQLLPLQARTSLTGIGELKEILSEIRPAKITAIILGGALVDTFAEELIYSLKIKNCQLVVRDGTRIFLNKRNLNLLVNNNIDLKVLDSIELLAVTVNPYSPYQASLDSAVIVKQLREHLPDIPVYDVLSTEYEH